MARKAVEAHVRNLLLVRSGNQCAFPGCERPLYNDSGELIAQLIHIEAANPGGERFNRVQTDDKRAAYENLLYLCYEHHVVTDNVSEYPVPKLQEIKRAHEARFRDGRARSDCKLDGPLVRAICGLSEHQYRQQLFLPHGWVGRRADDDLERQLLSSRASRLVPILSSSGYGKSTVCYKLQTRLNATGRLCLWLSHEHVANALTLEEALAAVLRAHGGPVHTHAPNEFLSVAQRFGGIFLVVDDLTRASDAVGLVERVQGWLHGRAGPCSVIAVCPLRHSILDRIRPDRRKSMEQDGFELGPFQPSESAAAVLLRAQSVGVSLTGLQAAAIADRLGHDPLVLSVWSPSTDTANARDVVAEFIRAQVRTVEGAWLTSEYVESLVWLGARMVSERLISPTVADLRRWEKSDPEFGQMVRDLLRAASLIRNQDQVLTFRHDRLRDSVLRQSVERGLTEGTVDLAVLEDPFLTRTVAEAVVATGTFGRYAELFWNHNPTVLVAAAAYSGTRDSILHQQARAWCKAPPQSHLPAVQHLAESILYESAVDNPIAADLAQIMPGRTWNLLLARARAGDLFAAGDYCRALGLGTGDPYRDGIVAHLRHVHAGQRPPLIDAMSKGTECVVGYLILLGYLGTPGLDDELVSLWNSASPETRDRLLTSLIWAALRCTSSPRRVLQPIVDHWRQLPSQKEQDGYYSKRMQVVTHGLEWALPKTELSEAAVTWLVELFDDEALGGAAAYLVQKLDHPLAVRRIVIEAARIREAYPDSGSALFWLTRAHDTFDTAHSGTPMNGRSRQALRTIWEDSQVGEGIRYEALSMWCINATIEETDVLARIGLDERFFELSLRARALAGDRTCLPLLLPRLQASENAHYWWQFAHGVWGFEVDNTLRHLWTTHEIGEVDWYTAAVLDRVPRPDANAVLGECWEQVSRSGRLLQAVLLVGDDDLVQRAVNAIECAPEPERLLRHFWQFGNSGIRRMAGPELVRLAPLLPFMDDLALDDIWARANDLQLFQWRREFVDPVAGGRQDSRRRVTEADDERELEQISGRRAGWIRHWIEEGLTAGHELDALLDTLERFCLTKATDAAWTLYADAVEGFGSRSHLARLERISTEGNPALRRTIESARFGVLARTWR